MLVDPTSDLRVPGASTRFHRAFLTLCAVLLAAAMAWAAWVPLEEVVRIPGRVRPMAAVSTVKNVVAGTVESKGYSPGSAVGMGQVLWSIDTSALSLEASNMAKQIQRLRRQWAELRAYLAVLGGTGSVPDGMEGAQLKAATFFAHLHSLELVAHSKKDHWVREAALPSSLVVPGTLADLEDAWRMAELDVTKYRAQQIDETTTERRQILTAVENLESRLASLRTAMAAAVVRSPLEGLVEEGRRFNPGDHLVAGEDILRVVPAQEQGLRLELRVDPRDVARLRVGQVVRAWFPGLPPSRFGESLGRVRTIAPDATMIEGALPSFAVEVSLDRSWVSSRTGVRVDLRPGMMVDARIIVGTRPALVLLWETLEVLP